VNVIALGISVLLAGASPNSSGVQLLNPDVLGQPTSQPVKLLADGAPGRAEPFVLWTDVRCGRYVAASAFYRKPVRTSDVVSALDALYLSSKIQSGPTWLWRVTDKHFAIQLAEEKDVGAIRVTYMVFRETPKDLPKFMSGPSPDDDCSGAAPPGR